MKPRRLAAVAALLVATTATAAAQSRRAALDVVAATDASVGSDAPRFTGVWFDAFAAVRVFEGFDLVIRPIVNRRTFDGDWQKQMYQLGVRYERPGLVGLRVEAGQLPSPIGLGILENRPDLNPVVSQHSAYYLPVPRFAPGIPRTYLIAASYPLGAHVTASGRTWDARFAVTDGSAVRGRPFFGSTKPPRMANVIIGAGIKPAIGLRIGGAVAHGGYMTAEEMRAPDARDRNATTAQVEVEWSFGYTRLAGELLRSSYETTLDDAVARGGWVEVTQTITPRVFVAGRADGQQFRYPRPAGDHVTERYDRYEAVLGFRLTPDITLRGGYMVRNGYVVSHWDDHLVVSAVFQRRIW